jgi:hypothetical protein
MKRCLPSARVYVTPASPQPDRQQPALTPRQESIAKRLRQLGEGPVAFFLDACELLAEQPPRRTVTHLVAHLLRARLLPRIDG